MTKVPKFPVSYRNAMEPLAIAEVQRQLQALPPEKSQDVNVGEAIAYALNRLPPLYATTVEGWQWHQERGRQSLADLISMAASWGIREAQRKSKSFSTPLVSEDVPEELLRELQIRLGRFDLDWDNIVTTLEVHLTASERNVA